MLPCTTVLYIFITYNLLFTRSFSLFSGRTQKKIFSARDGIKKKWDRKQPQRKKHRNECKRQEYVAHTKGLSLPRNQIQNAENSIFLSLFVYHRLSSFAFDINIQHTHRHAHIFITIHVRTVGFWPSIGFSLQLNRRKKKKKMSDISCNATLKLQASNECFLCKSNSSVIHSIVSAHVFPFHFFLSFRFFLLRSD